MPQWKKIKIDGVEGRGYLEVISPPPPRTRKRTKGIAVFDTLEKARAMSKAQRERRAPKYEGVVYDQGKATVVTCPVLISNVLFEGSGAQVSFEAQGNPYSD